MVDNSPGAKASVREVSVGPTDPHESLADTRGNPIYTEGDVLKSALVIRNVLMESRLSTDNTNPSEPVA